jgi:hypothetical protein
LKPKRMALDGRSARNQEKIGIDLFATADEK